MKAMVVLVAGGTGFVGRRVAQLLERRGHRVIISNRQQRSVPTHADVVINLVGIIRENVEQSYDEAHLENTQWLVNLGKKLHVRQFVQVSAIGASHLGTPYQRSKAEAERIVSDAEIPFVIVRPSLIFGSDDKSINRMRRIARTGLFPVLANGKMQPVSVDTVAAVIVAAAELRTRRKRIEIGGPEVFTQKELVDRIHPGIRPVALPRFAIRLITLLSCLFTSLPTSEQIYLLNQDIVTKDKTVERLGINNPRLL
jgi:uncharacterized protein YbjT (DUF2867 family)